MCFDHDKATQAGLAAYQAGIMAELRNIRIPTASALRACHVGRILAATSGKAAINA